jgi:SAM-dependent methyltransferase
LLAAAPVTDRLHGRLAESDIDTVDIEGKLNGELGRLWRESGPQDRQRLALALGVHFQHPAILEKTGLNPVSPPDDVHAMSRGPLAAGGDYYYSDLVMDALAMAGLEPAAGMRALDFGCSSGRVVRVLAVVYPEVEWHGCDPLVSPIAWAKENLPGVYFRNSPEEPPLPYDTNAFHFAYAISIWSHFGEDAGRRWLTELHRVMRPGGVLVLTTHGWHSVAHYAKTGIRSVEQLAEISSSLYERGFWYRPEFGEAGDHGLVNPEWGTAFMTAEWLLSTVCPEWRIVGFAGGRVEANQDLFVLQRA